MPPRRPLGKESIVIIRAPLVREARTNSDIRDWDNATRTTIEKCNCQPFPLAEKLNLEISDNREYGRSSVRVFAPAGTVIEYTDRIEYRGEEYEVFGFPGEWQDMDAVEHHVAFVMRIRRG